jgi:GT2 family glycosyltransferase/glycosyltransferase involved in cell wall biosynthesis
VTLAVRIVSRGRPRTPDATPTFPEGVSPEGVSIVIPTWNARDLLATYLPSLRAATARAAFPWEVIVVDNGSTDGSAAFVREVFPEFRVLELPENRGFAEGVNAGARDARYRVLYALNNDMEVSPDFLDAVLPLFANPNVFAVASRIDFPSGKRREESGLTSGRVVRGRLELRHHFDVDDEVWPTLYAGGGSSAFDRARFLALGGFDPLYRPFYVEDLDLGLRAWSRGWTVLYQPASRVVHQHRGTIGRHHDARALDRVYAANLLLLAWRNLAEGSLSLRHAAWLPRRMARAVLGARQQVPPAALLSALRRVPSLIARARADRASRVLSATEVFRVSGSKLAYRERTEPLRVRRSGDRLGVLFVSPYCPYPPSHGGAVRMYNLMREVARRHDVYLVSMIEYEKERAAEAHLRTFCRDVRFHLRTPTPRTGFLDPISVQEFYSDEFARLIELVLGARDIDVIQMEYTVLAHFLPESARLRSVLTEIDLYFVSYLRAARAQAGIAGRALGLYEWLRMFRYEMKWCDRYDLVLAMSDHDRDVLARYVPARKIAVVTNGVDLSAYPMREETPVGEEVLFVGNFRHAPNVDSILHFHREVWPRIRRKSPRATLVIAGGNAPDDVAALGHDPAVTVTGYVPDLGPLYARAAVFVAPITRGSGTRLKIVEAMAKGCPVVSTTLGAEGLLVTPGEHLIVADDPQAFADGVVALLDDPDLRARTVRAARRLVEEKYDWRAIAEVLTRAYDRLIEGRP